MIASLTVIDFLFRLILTALGYLFVTGVAGFTTALINKLAGDTTAVDEGFLTLDPFAHMEPLALLSFVLLGVGWRNPLPHDPQAASGRLKDVKSFIIRLSGFLSYIVCAFLGIGILFLLYGFRKTVFLSSAFGSPFIPIHVLDMVVEVRSSLWLVLGSFALHMIYLSLFLASWNLIMSLVHAVREALGYESTTMDSIHSQIFLFIVVAILFSPLVTTLLGYGLSELVKIIAYIVVGIR